MGQKCEMNEHIMARNSEEQALFLYHFWTNRFALCYLNKIPENRLLRNTLPETQNQNLPFSFILETFSS